MPADRAELLALAERAEAITGCKIGEIRPTDTGCGWHRPADKFVANAEANRKAAEAFAAANPFIAALASRGAP